MANQDSTPQNGSQGSSYLYNFGTTAQTRTAVSQKVRLLTPAYGDSVALHQMGVLASFSPTESKGVEPVRGIGYGDKVAELVPSVTEPMSGEYSRALLYLSNLWQATGYAGGIDGPVRSIAHHKWPFDMEQQLVFSSLADADLQSANVGYNAGQGGTAGQFDGGVKAISFPQVTPDNAGKPGAARGHSAIITIYEACWFTSWSVSFEKDAGIIMESGGIIISDVHDFASVYGEFLATGNDPTIGQLGSLRFAQEANGNAFASAVQAGGSLTGGGAALNI